MRLDEIDYHLDEAREVEILSKSGKKFDIPAFISVMQENSKVGVQATLEMQREIMELYQDENNLDVKTDDNGKETKTLKYEHIVNVSLKKLAKITAGWRGISDENGEEIAFSFENALMIYTKYEHIANTVYAFCANAENYLGKPQPTSLPTQSKAVGTQPSQTPKRNQNKKS